MSTELKSNTEGFALTRFFGGTERGVCIQVTDTNAGVVNANGSHIQLTKEQASGLIDDLLDFVNNKSEELE